MGARQVGIVVNMTIASQPYPVDTAHGLPRHYVPRKDGVICVTASPSTGSGRAVARQSMQPEVMDCFTAFAMTLFFHVNWRIRIFIFSIFDTP